MFATDEEQAQAYRNMDLGIAPDANPDINIQFNRNELITDVRSGFQDLISRLGSE
jgi:hypothetical protein